MSVGRAGAGGAALAHRVPPTPNPAPARTRSLDYRRIENTGVRAVLESGVRRPSVSCVGCVCVGGREGGRAQRRRVGLVQGGRRHPLVAPRAQVQFGETVAEQCERVWTSFTRKVGRGGQGGRWAAAAGCFGAAPRFGNTHASPLPSPRSELVPPRRSREGAVLTTYALRSLPFPFSSQSLPPLPLTLPFHSLLNPVCVLACVYSNPCCVARSPRCQGSLAPCASCE